ncbi:GNAT family N-acetyltransferase [Pyxidicoccus fallax]|uniref:GNAT family N-acetyltransferase n=1 Tax=Pyxidicoccus fallax TaxID=394095 RepID=A0A848LVI8_9BACT|nr:GNAT family N-acetyltransferase [Pyxidicoccus fallax]NMO22077.1 GNAT family N-acetyltransferase [Pyxidicoccus fallax]NPC83635.1 GNAT family N-acetyltransferase [Pyxidicoccus fallax]
MTVEVGQQAPLWVLRPGRPEDHSHFARLFMELGVDAPPPPPVWAAELMPLTVFAEGQGGVVAYAAMELLGEVGYVGQLVVDPSVRRQGLGRWMMERVAEHFRARGCSRWALNVKRDNTAALGLYTSVGMRPARQASTLQVTRAQVEALPPAPAGLDVVPAGPSDWEPLTAAFGMLPGRLAHLASLPSHKLLRLVPREPAPGPAAPLGMMDLRASSRTLYPLFAVSPAHARALLEDAFARLGGDVESLQVVVTDDAALEGLLRGAGAKVLHEMLELRGPLPEARG